jgi:hypothetical protein
MKHSNLEFQRVDTLPALTANSVIWIDKPDTVGDVAIWEHVGDDVTDKTDSQH